MSTHNTHVVQLDANGWQRAKCDCGWVSVICRTFAEANSVGQAHQEGKRLQALGLLTSGETGQWAVTD